MGRGRECRGAPRIGGTAGNPQTTPRNTGPGPWAGHGGATAGTALGRQWDGPRTPHHAPQPRPRPQGGSGPPRAPGSTRPTPPPRLPTPPLPTPPPPQRSPRRSARSSVDGPQGRSGGASATAGTQGPAAASGRWQRDNPRGSHLRGNGGTEGTLGQGPLDGSGCATGGSSRRRRRTEWGWSHRSR